MVFKKFFGGGKDEPVRDTLSHPRDLQAGDALKFGLDALSEISDQEFFVEKVSGLDLAAKTGYERRVFHLGQISENRPLLMWVDENKGGDEIALAWGGEQPQVAQLINLDQFGELFDPDRDYLVEVDRLPEAADNPWMAESYVQDQGQEIYWLDEDPATAEASNQVSNNEAPCDYFRLSSRDGSAAIEVFVFDGGQTDVYFVKKVPLYKIEELMPGG